MLKRTLIVSALALTGAWIAGYLFFTGDRPSEGAGVASKFVPMEKSADKSQEWVALQQQVARLDADVAALRRDMQQLKAASPANGAAVGVGESNDNDSASSQPDDIEQIMRERNDEAALLREKKRERMAAIESSFYNESPDPNWSDETADWVQQTLAKPEFAGVTSSGVECRTSMCIVKVTADRATASKLSFRLPAKLGRRLPESRMDSVDEGNGKKTLIFYLSREGYSVPH